MLFSIFDVLRIFEALQIFFYKFLLKWVKIEDFESSIFLKSQKYYFTFESRLNFFPNGHTRNVVSKLPNVVKIDVENDHVVSTFPNVVQFNVEIRKVLSRLMNLVNFSVDVHNVVSTLTWRCATPRHHINLKATLNRHWNVCWVQIFIARDGPISMKNSLNFLAISVPQGNIFLINKMFVRKFWFIMFMHLIYYFFHDTPRFL